MTAGRNPFHYGTPVEGKNFAGRRAELDALVERMRNGVSVVLLSPRRYGKTSLLRRAELELSGDRPAPAVIEVNVLRCGDVATLAGRLASAAYRTPGGRWHRVRSALPDFVRRLRVSPEVTFDADGRPVFSFSPALAPKAADDVIADVYAILASQADERAAVLVLDEFQAVIRLGSHLPDLLKGLADEYPAVVLVLAGSKRHMMERLVVSSEAPLYGMAQRMFLGPIPSDVMNAHLVERASTGGKHLSAAVAAVIVALAGPVPNDIQRLAFEAYGVAGDTIDEGAVSAGMAAGVAHEAAQYSERFAELSGTQARVLVALAGYDRSPTFSAEFARTVGAANASSVKRAIDALEMKELVVERDRLWVPSDPFLAAWLRGAGA